MNVLERLMASKGAQVQPPKPHHRQLKNGLYRTQTTSEHRGGFFLVEGEEITCLPHFQGDDSEWAWTTRFIRDVGEWFLDDLTRIA
jgi:hypothetical protein